MNPSTQPFTRIKGRYSEVRYLPRLGKIRLGLKKKSLKTGKEYPTETAHFVCPPEVEEIYGPEPIELDVIFPSDKEDDIFPQKYAMYGSSAGLKCHGNGERALRLVDEKTKEWQERGCPCEYLASGDCSEQSTLMVILPKVSMGGCYQIRTGSFHSTVAINGSIDYIKFLTKGKLAGIPLKLRREPRETHHDGKKQVHHTLNLIFDYDLATLQRLRQQQDGFGLPAHYQLEPPVDENPKADPVDEVVNEEEPGERGAAATETEEIADVHRALAGEEPDPTQVYAQYDQAIGKAQSPKAIELLVEQAAQELPRPLFDGLLEAAQRRRTALDTPASAAGSDIEGVSQEKYQHYLGRIEAAQRPKDATDAINDAMKDQGLVMDHKVEIQGKYKDRLRALTPGGAKAGARR